MTTCSLVTGAGRGIGAEIASALARTGHRVAVHTGRDRAAAERVAAGLPGDGHAVVVGDLADPDVCERVVRETVDALGDVTVLVNNAGIFHAHPIAGTSYAGWQQAWRETLAVNLAGPANLAWLVVDHLMRREGGPQGGRLIAVGSRGAYRGEPDTPAYAASKAALHAMTQSLAIALGPHGVLSAAVAPGFVETDMASEVLDGPDGDAVRAQSSMGRVARPDEVAAAVAWLATDAPIWVTGTVIDANGASYLR